MGSSKRSSNRSNQVDPRHLVRLNEAYLPDTERRRDPESRRIHTMTLFRLFLILAIGTCHVEQFKLAPSGTSLLFFDKAMENSKEVLMVEDLVSLYNFKSDHTIS